MRTTAEQKIRDKSDRDESTTNRKRQKAQEALRSIPPVSPAKGTNEMILSINALLANEFTLFTKTLNYHWNVTGPRFHSVHQFLEEHYKQFLTIIDDVAERVREIGGRPTSTLKELQDKSFLIERPGVFPRTSEMIADLLSDHETVQTQIKAIIKQCDQSDNFDPVTEDFMTNLLKQHEEMSWMLKSHLDT